MLAVYLTFAARASLNCRKTRPDPGAGDPGAGRTGRPEGLGMEAQRNDQQELRRLCWEGMLFEVQEWIRSGKSLPFGGDVKESPLALLAL